MDRIKHKNVKLTLVGKNDATDPKDPLIKCIIQNGLAVGHIYSSTAHREAAVCLKTQM